MLNGCRAAPVPTEAPVPTSLPASACSGSVLAGDIGVSIMAGGVRRSVIVRLPKGYTDLVHEPLLLNLHGSGSNAIQQEGLSGMDAAADADGFVVAYPQGAITSGSGFDWNVPGEPLFGGGAVRAPYNGEGQAYWTYSVPVAAQRWAAHDGCAASPVFTDQPAGAQCTEFTGCEGGAEVILCTLTGEGHEWPGGPALPLRDTDVLGPQTNAVDANATMWQFFTAHPLPSSVTASTS